MMSRHRFIVMNMQRTCQRVVYENDFSFVTPTNLKHARLNFIGKIRFNKPYFFTVRRMIKNKDRRYKKGFRLEWITVYEEIVPVLGS